MKTNNIKTVMLNSFQHLHLNQTLNKEEEILNQVQDDNIGRTAFGFTLIELLVVVLIIGILAAVAVPQYQKAIYKSKAMESLSILSQVVKAQKVYYLSNGFFAEDAADLILTFPVSNKKVNIKNNIYCYSALPEAKSDQRIVCSSDKPALSLQQYLNHDRFLCCAYAKDNYAAQTFCQQYTHSTTGKSLCGEQNPCLCYEPQ